MPNRPVAAAASLWSLVLRPRLLPHVMMQQSPAAPLAAGNGAVAASLAASTAGDQWQPQLLSTQSATAAADQSCGWSPYSPSSSNGRSDMKRESDAAAPEVRKRIRKSEPVDQRQAKLDAGLDYYCWTCHKEKAAISCGSCARSFHGKCLASSGMRKPAGDEKLVCPECQLASDMAQKPARALKSLTRQELNQLIVEVVQSVKQTADASFHVPVVFANYPDYKEKIVHPVSFQDLEKKCRDGVYTTPHEMVADLMWILHNSVIYNSAAHALTANAKSFLKMARGKVVDMEICPDCFKNFNTKPGTWFAEPCRKPHVLVLARVTGWPFWPAKLIDINRLTNEAEVRFFGSGHERAWVKIEQCFQLSEKDCFASGKAKGPKNKLLAALTELREHISKLESRFAFKYPYAEVPKTIIDPRKLYTKVRDNEPEDLLSDLEPEPEPDPLEEESADSPSEAPLQIDEAIETPAKPSDRESKILPEQGVTVPPIPSSSAEVVPVSAPEQVKKSEPQKNTPVQRNKIAQNLKKTLETRRSQSLTASDAEDVAVPCEADAVRIAKLKAEVTSLKRELDQEKRNHMRAMAAEKTRLESAIAEMKREKDQALQKAKEALEKEHEDAMRNVKNKQWCAQCSNLAQYYCCWNTSYCSIQCQNFHWQQHVSTCQQQQQQQQQQVDGAARVA